MNKWENKIIHIFLFVDLPFILTYLQVSYLHSKSLECFHRNYHIGYKRISNKNENHIKSNKLLKKIMIITYL